MSIKLMSIADTAKLIKSIKTRANGVQRDIHIAAVSTLAHIRDHGDYTGAVALMNALPTGQRVKGLAVWYKHFSNGKFRLTYKNKVWAGSLEKDRDAEDFDVDAATDVTFAEFTTEAEPKQSTVDTLRKYLEKMAANDEKLPDGKPKVTEEARALAGAALRAIAA
jgi:hypothetical protein